MKNLTIIVFISFLSLSLKAQRGKAYYYTFGGTQDDYFNQVKMTKDSGFIAIGTTSSFGPGNTNFYIVKTDSLCKHKWSKAIGGNLNQWGYSVAPTYDNGYAFVGFTDSYGNGGYDVFLVKTDSVGNIKWQKTYGGTDWDFGYSIKETPADSGFIICGTTYSYGKGNGDVYVIKTDKNGDTLWTRTIGGTGYDVGNSVYVHSSSLYAIVGATTSYGKGDTDIYFLALDNKGNIKKDTTFGSTHNDVGYSIAGTSDGGYSIIGYTDSLNPGTPAGILLKTDSLGKIQWTQFLACTNFSVGKDVVQYPSNGSYLTIGSTTCFGVGQDLINVYQFNSGSWYMGGNTLGGASNQFGNSVTLGPHRSILYGGSTACYGQRLYDGLMIRMKLVKDTMRSVDTVVINYVDTLGPASVYNQVPTQVGAKIFPNPLRSEGTVLIQGTSLHGSYVFKLYDVTGRNVATYPLKATNHDQASCRIEKSSLASGIYFYEISKEDIRIAKGKLEIIQ